jgi:hypothetical protein
MAIELSNPEDTKIVTLARSVRARTRAAEGACARDTDGRTYAGATVALPSLQVSAIGVAVAMAASSAAAGLEAVAVLGGGAVSDEDLGAIREFAGEGVTVYLAAADGSVLDAVTT